MQLTQDQAYIILCEFTNLSYSQIANSFVNFKEHSTGQYSVLLITGNKLKFDTEYKKFYLDSYHYSEYDNLYVYDFLELLSDYWEMKEYDIECSEQPIELIEKEKKSLKFKKLCYDGYKNLSNIK